VGALSGFFLVGIGSVLPAGRRGGPVGGSPTSNQAALQSWLNPTVPWALVVTVLVTLALASAALSMLAWSGSRRNHDLRSIGKGPHSYH
jgi:hypothetical protein